LGEQKRNEYRAALQGPAPSHFQSAMEWGWLTEVNTKTVYLQNGHWVTYFNIKRVWRRHEVGAQLQGDSSLAPPP